MVASFFVTLSEAQMIPQGALEIFATSVAKTLHEKTRKMVGNAVSGSYFETNFHFVVGSGERQTVKIKNRDLERAHSWQGLHDKIVEHVLREIKAAEGPGFIVDENGRRHFFMRAETGFLTNH